MTCLKLEEDKLIQSMDIYFVTTLELNIFSAEDHIVFNFYYVI